MNTSNLTAKKKAPKKKNTAIKSQQAAQASADVNPGKHLLMMLKGETKPAGGLVKTSSTLHEVLRNDLYVRKEATRRKEIFHRRQIKENALCDLHIVLPLDVNTATILVENSQGANFNTFDDTHTHAALLFAGGCEASLNLNSPGDSPEDKSVGRSPSFKNDCGLERTNSQKMPANLRHPSVCDIWASFLNVRLGSIFNVPKDLIEKVVNLFNSEIVTKKMPKITFKFEGIVKEKKDRSNDFTYCTIGVPDTPNDLECFKNLRKMLEKFAERLMIDFGEFGADFAHPSNAASPSNLAAAIGMPAGSQVHITTDLLYYYSREQKLLGAMYDPVPRLRVELLENLRASETDGRIAVPVREWSPVEDPKCLAIIANQNRRSNPKEKCTACAREIRVEHTHYRQLDPRWPDNPVVCRRIADGKMPNLAPEKSLARKTFRHRDAPIPVMYVPNVREDMLEGLAVKLKGKLHPLLREALKKANSKANQRSNQPSQNSTPTNKENVVAVSDSTPPSRGCGPDNGNSATDQNLEPDFSTPQPTPAPTLLTSETLEETINVEKQQESTPQGSTGQSVVVPTG